MFTLPRITIVCAATVLATAMISAFTAAESAKKPAAAPAPAASQSPTASDEDALTKRQKLLDLQNKIQQAETEQQLAQLKREKDLLALQFELAAKKQEVAMADLKNQLQRLESENKLREEKARANVGEKKSERDNLSVENDLLQEKARTEKLKSELERNDMDLETRRMDFETRRIQLDQKRMELERNLKQQEVDRVEMATELRNVKDLWEQAANREPEYLKNPYVKGRLVISDRRIPLNGPIVGGVADYVTDRIEYFNNKSTEYPIFLVIDVCPGGSVMEGYRIVKAIQSSAAPVHVVVKSFAASMAAVIATVAPKSYAYPNAIILHHQISSMMGGNVTQQKEHLAIIQEWSRRLHEPVAKKMGMSMEELVKRMYAANSDGDWQEFGDQALKVKWVDHLVDEVRETGRVKNPDLYEYARYPKLLGEQKDPEGRPYVQLPRLEPFDVYFIHNPDGYYR